MNCDPYKVVRDFEAALCEYTGAKYAVTTTSCTMALLLAVKWFLYGRYGRDGVILRPGGLGDELPYIEIPKHTYISVPMSIIHAGGWPVFRDDDWQGAYQLKPLPVWDCARMFTSGMFNNITASEIALRESGTFNKMQCVSFHASKILGDTQGGSILHDNDEADAWLRRARFDGRTEGIAPKDDRFTQIGFHCYLSPDVAARLLLKLSVLPAYNDDLPNDEYPDLSKMEIFQ